MSLLLLAEILAVSILTDVTVGVIRYAKEHRFRSKSLKEGVYTDFGELAIALGILGVHWMLRDAGSMDFFIDSAGTLLSYFILANLVSVLGHAHALGIPVPKLIENLIQKEVDDKSKGK